MRGGLVVLVALAGCVPAGAPVERAPGAEAVAPRRGVRVDGVPVEGRWRAVEVVGDARATRDLRDGVLEIVLVVNPGGHVILRGVDRREGGGAPAAYSGRLDGVRVAFRGLAGEARLHGWGRHLALDDPRGRRTVFVRLGADG